MKIITTTIAVLTAATTTLVAANPEARPTDASPVDSGASLVRSLRGHTENRALTEQGACNSRYWGIQVSLNVMDADPDKTTHFSVSVWIDPVTDDPNQNLGHDGVKQVLTPLEDYEVEFDGNVWCTEDRELPSDLRIKLRLKDGDGLADKVLFSKMDIRVFDSVDNRWYTLETVDRNFEGYLCLAETQNAFPLLVTSTDDYAGEECDTNAYIYCDRTTWVGENDDAFAKKLVVMKGN